MKHVAVLTTGRAAFIEAYEEHGSAVVRKTRNTVEIGDYTYHLITGRRGLKGYTLESVVLLPGFQSIPNLSETLRDLAMCVRDVI